jgi:hypothetical protein
VVATETPGIRPNGMSRPLEAAPSGSVACEPGHGTDQSEHS